MYALDHIVHFVDKPENLVGETRLLGLHTVHGGKHDMWGTYNSLSYFGLSYIEFIGVFDQALLEKSASEPFTLHESYKKRNYENGLTRIAIRTDTIEKDAESLREAGFTVYGPDDFSRTRPDGSVVKWKLLHFGQNDLEFPFLIQWEGTDEERYDELVQLGTIDSHPLGDLKIEEIIYSTPDLTIAKEWAKIFKFELEEKQSSSTLKTPNCFISFHLKETGKTELERIVIKGAKEEKEVKIEGATYQFIKS